MKESIQNIILAFGLYLFIWILFHWPYLISFPSLASAFHAKQYCSCIYVMKAGEEFCETWTKQWIPISKVEHRRDEKSIEVTALFVKNTARHIGEEKGCRLD